jgi:hypothetical protein
VLRLADQVGGDVAGVRGVVGDDRDLGRAGVALGADAALGDQLLLGERDVEVAGADDLVAAGPTRCRRPRRRSPARRRPRRPCRRPAAWPRQDGRVGPAGAVAVGVTPVGGVHSTISSTPAIWAGTAVMIALDGSGHSPPGTYTATRWIGLNHTPMRIPSRSSSQDSGFARSWNQRTRSMLRSRLARSGGRAGPRQPAAPRRGTRTGRGRRGRTVAVSSRRAASPRSRTAWRSPRHPRGRRPGRPAGVAGGRGGRCGPRADRGR